MNITHPLPHRPLPKVALLPFLLMVAGLASCSSFTVNEAAHDGTMKVGSMLLGTAVGAVIGHQSGRAVEGALLGAWAGSLAGKVTGDSMMQRTEEDESSVADQRLRQARTATTR